MGSGHQTSFGANPCSGNIPIKARFPRSSTFSAQLKGTMGEIGC